MPDVYQNFLLSMGVIHYNMFENFSASLFCVNQIILFSLLVYINISLNCRDEFFCLESSVVVVVVYWLTILVLAFVFGGFFKCEFSFKNSLVGIYSRYIYSYDIVLGIQINTVYV